MGALDILAQVVKDHEAKKAYGTPFYAQELAKIAQQQQAADIANQTGQFKLDEAKSTAAEEAPLKPLMLQAKIDELKGKGAKSQAEAELTGKKAAGYDEAQRAINGLKDAQAALATAKGPAAQLAAQAAMTRAQAALHKALNPTAPAPSYILKEGDDGQLYGFNPKNPGAAPILAGGGGGPSAAPPQAGAVVTPGATPPPAAHPFHAKSTAQTQNRRDQAALILQAIPDLLKQVDDPEIQSHIGPPDLAHLSLGGVGSKMKDTVGMLDPKTRGFRTGLKSLADLLPVLHGFRGGTALANQFQQMVGDVQQGGPQLKASLGALQRLATIIHSGGDQAAVEAEIANAGGGGAPAAGGIDPEVEKRLKAAGY